MPCLYPPMTIESNHPTAFEADEKKKKRILGLCKTALLDIVSKKRVTSQSVYSGKTHRVCRVRFVVITSPIWIPLQILASIPRVIIIAV